MNQGLARSWHRFLWIGALLLPLLLTGWVRAEEVIPAVPTRYFNDYAMTVKPETADRLNAQLEDFERQTSNQLRVAIYPKMQSQSDVADYCQRVARSWKVGQKEQRNGAILFVFVQDHKDNIQVGYGLEGALTDATTFDILQNRVKPLLKQNNWDGAMTTAVDSMMQATKGEYKGTGRTNYEQEHQGDKESGGLGLGTIIFIIILFFIFSSFLRRRGGTMFSGGGPTFFPIGFGGGSGGGGSFSGGGGGGSSDGGGFASSGGGDFGGGGASGDW